MAEPELVNGKFVMPCTHGFNTWHSCGVCCMNLADMVPGLLREIDALKAKLDKKTKKSRRKS